ncbi:MAG: hypothetical protein EPO26_03025 [Chloroflexota bacterium]|nr:MAG: hypothetical protein EPO26_03025 [Chloroflexota bacterium]
MRSPPKWVGALGLAGTILASLLFASTASAAGDVVPLREAQVRSIDGLNVRGAPDSRAAIVAVAEGGVAVTLLDEFSADGLWQKVSFDNTVGWVVVKYLGTPRERRSLSTRGDRRGFTTEIGARLPVPYRSQLDGSLYEAGNCGPAAIGMVIEAFGAFVPTTEIRRVANSLQGTAGWYTSGTSPSVLAYIAEEYGLIARGLFSGSVYDKWSFDEVRRALRNGHLVIPQVHLASLPGQERSNRSIDHFIVIFGYEEDRFLYHDPAFPGGGGHSLWISETQLERAWRRSDLPFAAFSIGPGGGKRPLIDPVDERANDLPATRGVPANRLPVPRGETLVPGVAMPDAGIPPDRFEWPYASAIPAPNDLGTLLKSPQPTEPLPAPITAKPIVAPAIVVASSAPAPTRSNGLAMIALIVGIGVATIALGVRRASRLARVELPIEGAVEASGSLSQ